MILLPIGDEILAENSITTSTALQPMHLLVVFGAVRFGLVLIERSWRVQLSTLTSSHQVEQTSQFHFADETDKASGVPLLAECKDGLVLDALSTSTTS